MPKEWPSGSARGLRARGAFDVDIVWKKGRLEEVIVKSLKGVPLTLHYAGKTIQLNTEAGKTYKLNDKLKSGKWSTH